MQPAAFPRYFHNVCVCFFHARTAPFHAARIFLFLARVPCFAAPLFTTTSRVLSFWFIYSPSRFTILVFREYLSRRHTVLVPLSVPFFHLFFSFFSSFFFLFFFLPLPPPNASRVCFLFSTLSAVYTQLSEKLFAATLGKPEKLLPTVESVDFSESFLFFFLSFLWFGLRFSREEILLGCLKRVSCFAWSLMFQESEFSSTDPFFFRKKKFS